VRSGGQSHFHAPAAIKSWAARGLIMRARIYVNAAPYILYEKKNRNRPYTNNTFCTFLSHSCGLLRWQRIISQSAMCSLLFPYFKMRQRIYMRQSELVWCGQNLAPRPVVKMFSAGDSNFSAGKKASEREISIECFHSFFFIIFQKRC
jgi:hypothetical protein